MNTNHPHSSDEPKGDPTERALTVLALDIARRHYDRSPGADEFIFARGEQAHPTWDDAPAIFAMAAKELAGRPGVYLPGEIPLLHIGWHVKVRFTTKRLVQGFLATDRRLIVQYDPSLIAESPLPRTFPYPIGSDSIAASSAILVDNAMALMDWDLVGKIMSLESQGVARNLLVELVTKTTQSAEMYGIVTPVKSAEPSRDPKGRADELGLTDSLKFSDQPKQGKHLSKVAKAFQLAQTDQLIFTITDGTLIGVYGLALTDSELVSRDLGEDPIRIQREDIDVSSIHRVSDSCSLLINGQEHILPSHLSANKVDSIVELLKTVLA